MTTQVAEQPLVDVNLVEEVIALLKENHFSDEQINHFRNDPNIRSCLTNPSFVQILEINQYWLRECYRELPEVPGRIRICFSLASSSLEWLAVFRDQVIPFLKEHHIPRVGFSNG